MDVIKRIMQKMCFSSYKTIDDAKFLSKQKRTYIKRNGNERIVYLWLYFTMCDTYLLFWSTLMAGLKENRLLCPLRSFWFLSTYRLTIMCKLEKINLWNLWNVTGTLLETWKDKFIYRNDNHSISKKYLIHSNLTILIIKRLIETNAKFWPSYLPL